MSGFQHTNANEAGSYMSAMSEAQKKWCARAIQRATFRLGGERSMQLSYALGTTRESNSYRRPSKLRVPMCPRLRSLVGST